MNTPFRLGTTSFIHPGGWLANVERLAGRVSDIEILFFETDALPSASETRDLAEWKTRAGLTYSLHTPLDVSLATANEGNRRAGVASVRRAIEAAAPFAPEVAIVHVYFGEREHDENRPADLCAWRARAERSLREILEVGIAPADLCVEVLDYDFSIIEPVIADLGLSVAVDLGHLVRDGKGERDVLLRNLHRTRVIQWHGTDGEGRDHRSLMHYPRDRARWLLSTLRSESYPGVLTIEVFREADLAESLALVASLLAEEAA